MCPLKTPKTEEACVCKSQHVNTRWEKIEYGPLHKRKVITLLHCMWKDVQQGWEFETPPAFSYRRKAIWLHAMWKTFYTSWRPAKIQNGTCRRETMYLQPLRKEIQSRCVLKKTPKNPHWNNFTFAAGAASKRGLL